MKNLSFKFVQVCVTVLVTIFVGCILFWEKLHGGVVTHHIFQRSELPGISNWWGLLILPMFCWISLNRIKIRLQNTNHEKVELPILIRKTVVGFFGSLLFGIVLAVATSYGYKDFIDYQVDFLLLSLFFIPIYKSEYLFGFVLGMTISLGVILPTAFALIIALLSAIVYLYVRPIIIRFLKINKGKK